jgi:hypothetical protein
MLIAKGDRLILYTDGLVEVFNSLDVDVEGLKALILESARRPIRKLKEAILNGVTTWGTAPLRRRISRNRRTSLAPLEWGFNVPIIYYPSEPTKESAGCF